MIVRREILIFSIVFAFFSLGLASYAYSETVTFDNGGKRTTTTDPNGNTIITLFSPRGSIIWEKILDPDDRLLEKADYDSNLDGEYYVETRTVYVYDDDDMRTELTTTYHPSGKIKSRWYEEQKYRQPDWVSALDYITPKEWVTEKEWGEKSGKVYPKNQQPDQDVGYGVNAGTTSSIDFGDSIPSWVKTNALWWSENQIDDKTFALSIGHLVKENIIKVDSDKIDSTGSLKVSDSIIIPSWIQNNAKWWAEGAITDGDFKEGIQYMFQENIISFDAYKWPEPPVPKLTTPPNLWETDFEDFAEWYGLAHELSPNSDVIPTVYEIKKWNEFAMNELLQIKNYEASFLKEATNQAWEKYAQMDKESKLSSIKIIQELEKSSIQAESDVKYSVQILKDSIQSAEEVKEYAKDNDISVLDLEEIVKEVQEKIDDMPEIKSKKELEDSYKEAKLAQQKMKDGLKQLEQIEIETPVIEMPNHLKNEPSLIGQLIGQVFLVYDDGPWDEGGHEPKGSIANDGTWGITESLSDGESLSENETAVTSEIKCELEDDWIWPSGTGDFYIPPDGCSVATTSDDYDSQNLDRVNFIISGLKSKSTDVPSDDDSGTSDRAIMCWSYPTFEPALGFYFDDDKERFASAYVRDSIVAGFECPVVSSINAFDCDDGCPQQVPTNSTKSILFDVSFKDGKSLVGPYGLTAERRAQIAIYETIGMLAVYDFLLEFNGIHGHKIITDSAGLEKFEENLIILDEVLPDYEEQIQCDEGYNLVGNECHLETPPPSPPPADNPPENTDTIPPTITVPSDITVESTGDTFPISFSATAIDETDGVITPTCNHSSGSNFPIGTTQVICTATDKAGNTVQESFSVKVAKLEIITYSYHIHYEHIVSDDIDVWNFFLTVKDSNENLISSAIMDLQFTSSDGAHVNELFQISSDTNSLPDANWMCGTGGYSLTFQPQSISHELFGTLNLTSENSFVLDCSN